jgi:hypothetical protein
MTRLRTLYHRVTTTTRVVPLLALLATTAALVAFVIQHPTAAVWALVVALVLALAGMVTLVAEANAERATSDARHTANEILCAELAVADEIIRRLHGDLLAAQLLASDAREELAAEPAPVIPLPRRGSHDDLAALDAEATAYTWPAIARDAFPVREWGEEAEK